MKALMLGWEFPPVISGGLGTACYGLTKAMGKLGIEITFVLPSCGAVGGSKVKLVDSNNPWAAIQTGSLKHVRFHTVPAMLTPYATAESYSQMLARVVISKKIKAGTTKTPAGRTVSLGGKSANYGHDIFQEVHRYEDSVMEFAPAEDFDVVHAHDWMTYPAGMAVAAATGKPLVVQVHSTEFDRSGENINQTIYDIERAGMHNARKVIAVSNYTRNIIMDRYSVQAAKIEVIHNGVESSRNGRSPQATRRPRDKVVLYMGRITMQKGPEYFIQAAKKVIGVYPNVRFIMAGTGDMLYRMIDLAAWLGIGHKVHFTGFLNGPEVQRAYSIADLYVMPSVSEPFGIAPLEAMDNDVPVLISKQSGVAEVLTHALKVDFWDTNEMANKMVAVLKRPPLHQTLRQNGSWQARQLRWEDAAQKCRGVYEEVLASA
jgi:glycosyltransferase involved in cell wall biosynthesis